MACGILEEVILQPKLPNLRFLNYNGRERDFVTEIKAVILRT